MFPRKIKLSDVLPNILPIVVCGQSSVFGLCITVDDVWRYVMSSGDSVSVDFVDNNGKNVLHKAYSEQDMNADDNIIVIRITDQESAQIAPDRYYMNITLNTMILIHRYPVVFKEA